MLSRSEFALIGDMFRRSGLPDNRRAQMQIGLSFVLLIGAQAATVTIPFVFGALVDAIGVTGWSVLFALLSALAVIRFLSRFLANLKDYLFDWATYDLLMQLYVNAFHHALALPYSFFVDESSGGIAKAWDRGAWSSRSVIDALLYRFVPDRKSVV